MLWLCIDLPRLPLEALTADHGAAVAVVERKGSKRRLAACGGACAADGIAAGLDVSTALLRQPQLRLLDRSSKHEVQALKGLAVWAEQFASFVSFDPGRLCLWIEVGSGLRYFGGLGPLTTQIHQGLVGLGYTASIGIAPTPEAALLFARAGAAPVLDPSRLIDAIGGIPLGFLPIDPNLLASFAALGLRRLDDLFKLPIDALARRYGPALGSYLSRLQGHAPDPLRPYCPPQRYRRRFEFSGAIESYEGLLFPLRRILTELEGFLRARDAAVQRLQLVFSHERHADSLLDIRSTQPTQDAARLLLLVRERIERSVLAAPVEALTLLAKRLVPLGDTQLELLHDHGRRENGWSAVLDRLRARLGDDAVHGLGLQADHRPERACIAAAVETKDRDGDAPDLRYQRPLWLLAPRELQEPPQLIGKPERIEAGWWDGDDVQRDYYIAQTADGARSWVFREASGRWFVQGLWA